MSIKCRDRRATKRAIDHTNPQGRANGCIQHGAQMLDTPTTYLCIAVVSNFGGFEKKKVHVTTCRSERQASPQALPERQLRSIISMVSPMRVVTDLVKRSTTSTEHTADGFNAVRGILSEVKT